MIHYILDIHLPIRYVLEPLFCRIDQMGLTFFHHHQNKYHFYERLFSWIGLGCLYWQWLARSHSSPRQSLRRDRAEQTDLSFLNETPYHGLINTDA